MLNKFLNSFWTQLISFIIVIIFSTIWIFYSYSDLITKTISENITLKLSLIAINNVALLTFVLSSWTRHDNH